MTEVIVRPARTEDYPALARLTVSAYRADGQLAGDARYETVLADVQARAGAGELLVAEDPQYAEPVGTVLFVLPGSAYAELSAPGEAEFRMLAVDPSAQGRGVGEALVRACLDRATALGCRAVVIYTRDFASVAHRLYGRLGFVRSPERDWSPAPGIDLLAMRWELSETRQDKLPRGGRQ